MRLAPAGVSERLERLVLGKVPQKAHDQLGRDPKLAPRPVERIRQAGQHGVEGDAAPGVTLGIEEHLDMLRILHRHAREIGAGEIEEILPGPQHRHAGIVEIEKVLERVETVGVPDRVDIGIRQCHAVPLGERQHHLGFQRPFDVKMQFRLRHLRNETMKPCLVQGALSFMGTTSSSWNDIFVKNVPAFTSSPAGSSRAGLHLPCSLPCETG